MGIASAVLHTSDGGLRVCVDFRKLNAQTIPISYPMLHPQEFLDSCATHIDLLSISSLLSIRSQSWNQTGTDRHVAKRACTNLQSCLFSKILEEHQRHLDLGLDALAVHHYSSKKCTFGLTSVPCLGHTISADGLSPDPAKKLIISEWPQYTNLFGLRSFIGMMQYFRCFIPNISKKIWCQSPNGYLKIIRLNGPQHVSWHLSASSPHLQRWLCRILPNHSRFIQMPASTELVAF